MFLGVSSRPFLLRFLTSGSQPCALSSVSEGGTTVSDSKALNAVSSRSPPEAALALPLSQAAVKGEAPGDDAFELCCTAHTRVQ